MYKVVDNEFNRANYSTIIGYVYPDDKIPSYANVVACSNCKYPKEITHVVQAGFVTVRNWHDCKPAKSLEEAKRLEQELKADNNAWMPDDTERLTRIVIAQ